MREYADRELQWHGQELTLDHFSPLTDKAMRAYDDELRLVFNRRVGIHQIMRVESRGVQYHVDGFGGLLIVEPHLVWELDYDQRIRQGDNPINVAVFLSKSDMRPRPWVKNGEWLLDQIEKNRRELEKKSSENWKHATAANKGQLEKAWSPFSDYSGMVN